MASVTTRIGSMTDDLATRNGLVELADKSGPAEFL
jgi:hypothetical protein